jgi:dTDP-4-amino-4,6-dideoxygalactose transaminase
MWKIQLFEPNFDYREQEAAARVVADGWLTMGDRIKTFESEFSIFLGGSVKSTAVSNGTAALHMALLSLGIGEGDEVIIPALSFVADANVVRMVGARPILADCVSLDDWNISVENIRRKLTTRTKAVIAVHYAGYPCDMVEIDSLCQKHGLYLIEDVAHAPGASIAGRSCGAWGDVGCFSFFSNKNLSIGEGGMVVVDDAKLHQTLGYLRSHGMTTLTLDRHNGRSNTYDVAAPGLNYRMDEIRAAIGLVQLEKLSAGNSRRAEITARYRKNLESSEVLVPFANQPADMISAYHILPVLLPIGADRVTVMDSLKMKGIQSSIHYPPFWNFTAYAGWFDASDTPIAANICERELTLPLFPTMKDDEVDIVTTSLVRALQ